MSHSTVVMLFISLGILILIAAFFSASETGLMAINRYRLRHKARMKKNYAIAILKLLERPDRLLGMILIGSTFANILASALATLLAVHFWGDLGVVIETIALTFIMIIFAEVAPKTYAAIYPDRVAKLVVYPVYLLLKICYPIVWLVNVLANGFLRIFGIKIKKEGLEHLSPEELRTIVYETTGRISSHYQNMLLGILDLSQITVDEVMIPRHEIVGIDIEQPWDDIRQHIANSQHDWLPIYREEVNQIIGVLHIRDFLREITAQGVMNKDILLKTLMETYFIPEGTPLNVQLLNFQQQKKRVAFVVDEYGEILGLLTLADIFEEIVGEFTTTVASPHDKLQIDPDGSFIVNGAIEVRELNRATQWKFPIRGPRTLSGLMIEHLETIPTVGICVKIAGHPIEVLEVEDNLVKRAKVFPRMY